MSTTKVNCVCRLCFEELCDNTAIDLFKATDIEQRNIAKLIVKYFDLHISADDPISDKICQSCAQHLQNFHAFYLRVDEKQNSIFNEFIAVKCENILETIIAETDNERTDELLVDIKPLTDPFALNNADVDGANDTANLQHQQRDALDNSTEDLTAESAAKTNTKRSSLRYKKLLFKRKAKTKARLKLRQSSDDDEDDIDDDDDDDADEAEVNARKPKATSLKIKKSSYEQMVHDFLKFSCDLCDFCAESYHDLRSHFQSVHHKAAYIKCCNRTFYKLSTLGKHVDWHKNPDNFKCSICQKIFRNSKYLLVHKETVHRSNENALSVCSICQRGFSSHTRLENHMLTHNPDAAQSNTIFNCQDCSKTFRSEKRFENHKEKKECGRKFTCDVCEKSFPNMSSLRRHIDSIHNNVYKHVCDMCGKKFKFKPSFELHVQQHQGIFEPPEQCNECGKWLKNKHSLRLHRFTHKASSECKYCGRSCPSRTALLRHIAYMHKLQQILECQYCDKTFKAARNLEEHMAIHTGVQLYSCPHCSKECRSKSNMYVHIKRLHSVEWLKSKAARSYDPATKLFAAGIENCQENTS